MTLSLPCLSGNSAGLAVFQATADQRFLLGEDIFLRTHSPSTYWVNHGGKSATWSESDLLHELTRQDLFTRGNRLFLLFGAAGSGKSETMRWLQLRLAQLDQARSRYAVRISRSELDPIRVVAKIADAFGMPDVSTRILSRWDDLKGKPVALANQLAWSALSTVYQTDEEILPLSYRLRPIIETNLRVGLTSLAAPDEAPFPLQLLSYDQFEQIVGKTCCNINVVYEQMRRRLQESFEQTVLGDTRFVSTLRRISGVVSRNRGVRPILIIDDLVQSMNVYATDLLDSLITLEEGQWDVVVGITPAAFQWDRRGRELLTRLRELDTFDDRVLKLDLSDATGDTSSFLNTDTIEGYVRPYMEVCKQLGGYNCTPDACNQHARCVEFQWGLDTDACLTPLNAAFLRRIWDALPHGKGKARHLLLTIRDLLDRATNDSDGLLSNLQNFIGRDLYVNHKDSRIRALVECYHPSTPVAEPFVHQVPLALVEFWGTQTVSDVEVLSLGQQIQKHEEPSHGAEAHLDPGKEAIRDWLDRREFNPELIKPLRLGVAKFLRDAVDPTLLAGVGHAQPNGVVRWDETKDGTNLHVSIEGVDQYEGIALRRTLGSAAFDLLTYAEVTGRAKSQVTARILEHPEVAELIHQATTLQSVLVEKVTESLGLTVQELAFHLYRIAWATGADLLPRFMSAANTHSSTAPTPWPKEMVATINALWEDCFRLRDHLYDGNLLSDLAARWPSVQSSYEVIQGIDAQRIPKVVSCGGRHLRDEIGAVQGHLGGLASWLEDEYRDWGTRCASVKAAREFMQSRSRLSLERKYQCLESAAKGILALPRFPAPPPRHERDHMRQLLRRISGSPPEAFSLEFYDMDVAWYDALHQPWFSQVREWCDQIRVLYNQIGLLAPRTPKDPVGSGHDEIGVREIIVDLANHLAQVRSEEKARARVARLRENLATPDAQAVKGMAETLHALLPRGFEVERGFREERELALRVLGGFARAERALTQCNPSSCLDLDLPGLDDFRRLERAASFVSEWWIAYLDQLPLLKSRGRRRNTDDVKEMLVRFSSSLRGSEIDGPKWSSFLNYARRQCSSDLPLLFLIPDGKSTLTEPVKSWFTDVVKAKQGGLAISSLSPELLSDLLRQAPDWLPMLGICIRGRR